MDEIWAAVVFAAILWWVSTGLVLLADRVPRWAGRSGFVVTSLLALAAIAVLVMIRDMPTTVGAFAAFTAAIVVWGWHEVSFLAGVITGPRSTPCPPGAKGWRRFVYATETLIYHEVAIALTAVGLGLLLVTTANPVGFWAFVILWVMRLSTKLNIFFGVPDVTDEFMPDQMRYLRSYFRIGTVNPLLPVSIVLGLILVIGLAQAAFVAGGGTFAATGYALLATLAALAVLEHGFLVLPFRDAALWQWFLRRAGRAAKPIVRPVAPASGLGRPK